MVGNNYVVTITDNGGGSYTISDFSAGVYQEWYGTCYGYTFETTGNMVDVCNDLIITATDAWTCWVEGTGTYNSGTGEITYTWNNCFGDSGEVTLTPQ